MLGSDGVFDVLSDQARVQCVGFTSEQGTRNIPAERFAGSGGHHLARHGRGWKGCSQAGGSVPWYSRRKIQSLATGGLPKKW